MISRMNGLESSTWKIMKSWGKPCSQFGCKAFYEFTSLQGSVSGNKTHFAELERILKEIESQFPVWLMYMK
jgi:hypothetical protein